MSVPETSLAQSDDARARLLFDNGHQLYMEGRYEDALAAWTEAYALSQRPLILFNMANAYERNGQLEKAVAVLNRYRAYAQPDEQEVILRRIKNMEQRLHEQPQPIEQSRVSTPTAPFPTLEVMLMGSGAVLVSGVLLVLVRKTRTKLQCVGVPVCRAQGAVSFRKRNDMRWADVCLSSVDYYRGWPRTVTSKGPRHPYCPSQLTPTTSGMVMHGTFVYSMPPSGALGLLGAITISPRVRPMHRVEMRLALVGNVWTMGFVTSWSHIRVWRHSVRFVCTS